MALLCPLSTSPPAGGGAIPLSLGEFARWPPCCSERISAGLQNIRLAKISRVGPLEPAIAVVVQMTRDE
jgi:hypothetical protein